MLVMGDIREWELACHRERAYSRFARAEGKSTRSARPFHRPPLAAGLTRAEPDHLSL